MMHFLTSSLAVDEMIVMIQKEVAERINAEPGTKAYGSLTIAVQYYMETEISFIVPKTVFVPQPNVDSAILNLKRREQAKVQLINEKPFSNSQKQLLRYVAKHFGIICNILTAKSRKLKPGCKNV